MASAGTTTTAAPSAAIAPPKKGRKIVLLSDGTGNSSGKLFKTNVWRLYEALDLGPVDAGPAAPGKRPAVEQLAHYSNGVGTSSLRPLAILGGVFGFGLKSNILQLYKYLCRNWQDGDQIFLFGFSRGAFTIRLLVGLIASQGILRGEAAPGKSNADLAPDDDSLAYLARAAYRRFAGQAWPNRQLARRISVGVRWVRDLFLEAHRRFTKRKRYEPANNRYTDIAFVGVWDTVAAYGGPIIEITRGIDDWIWPLTMPNYQLSPRVVKARHALAIDDERDAFQPLLWDEVREEMLVKWGGLMPDNGGTASFRKVPPGRLKQVWFTGMHADVGGGYPDESLSFVSLLWMLDELGDALRLLPDHVRRIKGMANIFGPIHDSRAGAGAYYRYQPRRIAAMIEYGKSNAMSRSTKSLRDPEIADARYVIPPAPAAATPAVPAAAPPVPGADIEALAERIRADHGLLRSVHVHESVIERIRVGTDSYAPIGLPQNFTIAYARNRLATSTLPRATGDLILATRKASGDWFKRQARVFDMVWWRRVQYFTMVALSLIVATLPLWHHALDPLPGLCDDDRCFVRPVLATVDSLTGHYAGPWVGAFADHVLFSFSMLAAILLLFAYGSAYTLRLHSRAHRAWRQALGFEPMGPEHTARRSFARIRDKPAYQAAMTRLKWKIAPAIVAALMVVSVVNVGLALAAQMFVLPLKERRGAFCGDAGDGAGALRGGVAAFILNTAAACNDAGARLRPNQIYFIRVTQIAQIAPPAGTARKAGRRWRNDGSRVERRKIWRDGSYGATPAAGDGANLPWWIDITAAQWRRVMLAGWMQPIVHLRAPPPKGGDGAWQKLFGRPVDVQAPALACDTATGGYEGSFSSGTGGSLAVGVNDAVFPLQIGWRGWRPTIGWNWTRFYDNNRGFAIVQVWPGATPPPAVGDTLSTEIRARGFRVTRCTPAA